LSKPTRCGGTGQATKQRARQVGKTWLVRELARERKRALVTVAGSASTATTRHVLIGVLFLE